MKFRNDQARKSHVLKKGLKIQRDENGIDGIAEKVDDSESKEIRVGKRISASKLKNMEFGEDADRDQINSLNEKNKQNLAVSTNSKARPVLHSHFCFGSARKFFSTVNICTLHLLKHLNQLNHVVMWCVPVEMCLSFFYYSMILCFYASMNDFYDSWLQWTRLDRPWQRPWLMTLTEMKWVKFHWTLTISLTTSPQLRFSEP